MIRFIVLVLALIGAFQLYRTFAETKIEGLPSIQVHAVAPTMDSRQRR